MKIKGSGFTNGLGGEHQGQEDATPTLVLCSSNCVNVGRNAGTRIVEIGRKLVGSSPKMQLDRGSGGLSSSV